MVARTPRSTRIGVRPTISRSSRSSRSRVSYATDSRSSRSSNSSGALWAQRQASATRRGALSNAGMVPRTNAGRFGYAPGGLFANIQRGVLPPTTTTRLKTFVSVSLNPAVNARASVAIRANSPYQPIANTDQPRGWDDYVQFYDRYTVIASSCKVMEISPNLATTSPKINALCLSDEADPLSAEVATGGNFKWLEAENMIVDWKLVQPSSNAADHGGTRNMQSTAMVAKYTQNHFWGVDGSTVGLTDYSAATTASPNKLAYYTLYTQAAAAGTDLQAHQYIVEVEYVIQFTDPKKIASSA